MKSKFVPFIVIGSIFVADYLENYYIEVTKPEKEIEYVHVHIPVEKKMAAEIGETFTYNEMAYRFGKPEFKYCLGEHSWNTVCAGGAERKFIVIPYTVRNDGPTKEYIYEEFGLVGMDYYRYEDWDGVAALRMSGKLDVPMAISPNMQVSRALVFRVSMDENGPFELVAARPIVNLQ